MEYAPNLDLQADAFRAEFSGQPATLERADAMFLGIGPSAQLTVEKASIQKISNVRRWRRPSKGCQLSSLLIDPLGARMTAASSREADSIQRGAGAGVVSSRVRCEDVVPLI